MWRNEQAVFVQPLIGRRQHCAGAADTLSDIQTTHWPS
jgi:hypothetical protein